MEDYAAGDDEFAIAATENAIRISEQERLLLGSSLRSHFSKPLPFYPEPIVKKSHWDHVREEMRWLAGDYVRERKWRYAFSKMQAHTITYFSIRQKTARKFAFDSIKSRIDNDHITEQESAIISKKDTALRISDEVLTYWKKIHKVFSTIRQ